MDITKEQMIDRRIFICDCNSLEHQMSIWYDYDEDMIYFQPRLITYRNFFKRLWVGIRYAFGYKSRFGEWDEIILDPRQLKHFLDTKYGERK